MRVRRSTEATGASASVPYVGDEQARRVGSDVDRRDSHRRSSASDSAQPSRPRPTAPPDRRRPRDERHSARAGISRRCGSRRRRPTGAGRCGSREIGRRGPRRSARARPAARRDRRRAPAARTPPAASRRDTCSPSWRSTSQYRVGIGVPSSSSGALRITTGRPSASRTTTSNAARGSRPRQFGEESAIGGGHVPPILGSGRRRGGRAPESPRRRARPGTRSGTARGRPARSLPWSSSVAASRSSLAFCSCITCTSCRASFTAPRCAR